MSAARRALGVVATARRVALKELRTSLRDRQTLIYTVVLPLALYPALFWAWLQGSLVVQGRSDALVPRVALVEPSAEDAARLPEGWRDALEGGRDVHELGGAEADTEAPPGYELVAAGPEPLLALRATDVDLLLAFHPLQPSQGTAAGDEPRLRLYLDSTRARAQIASKRVSTRLADFREAARADAARARGLDPAELEPFVIEEHNIASQRDMGGFLLSFLLPLTFVLMTTLGAFLPAVDLTAGERERKTLETTLALPVPRVGLQLGKLLAVAALALVAALLNLGGMSLAARGLLAQLPSGAMEISIPAGGLLALVPFAILFALFVSAVLVAVASTAETFRQGQSQLGTVQLVFIVPAMVSVMPGIELTAALAPIPIVGLVLAFKSLLQAGPTPLVPLLIVAASLALYAGLALFLAARFLVSERATLRPGPVRLLDLLRSSVSRRGPRNTPA